MKNSILPVSNDERCGTNMTADKRKAIQDYLALAKELRDRRNLKGLCSPEEVVASARRRGCSFDHISWAFMLYCGPEMFHKVHAEAGSDANYTALRGAVAGTFFEGNMKFDAFDLSTGVDQSPGILGNPLDIDVGGLFN